MSKSKKQMKTTAILMPAMREQAEQLLHEIGSLQREVVKIEANMNDKLAGIKKQFELFAQPLNQQIENKFQALHIWAEANRSALLKGKSKTVKLATGELLWRTRPPHVSLPKNQDTVVQALISADLGHLVRTKQEVNKDAVLDDVDAVKGIAGIKIKRREEFVAKPFESQIERAEPVKTEVKAA
ncbi:MAG: host-nuclease inhibitor Gam family protein [Gammaproteobacteria bacterium]|nr:host-nuclease inhibitor Gam family protein [Gammaproteobacteria bacterium]